jgi:hypothetical protein
MRALLFDEPPLVVSPTLACKIGLQEAIVLQQMHYWAAHSKTVRNGRKWVYNTYKEWAEQFPFWKPESIRKIVAKLRAEGLLDVETLATDTANRTNYYAINYDRLDDISNAPEGNAENSTAPQCGKFHRTMRKNPPDHAENSTAFLYRTETTTETTQRKAPRSRSAAPSSLGVDELSNDGVDKQVAADWLTLRKAKRLPLTQTAWDGVKAEAQKVDMSPADAVHYAVQANWAGFRADWVQRGGAAVRSGAQPLNKQEALEARNREVAARLTAKFQAQHGEAHQ